MPLAPHLLDGACAFRSGGLAVGDELPVLLIIS